MKIIESKHFEKTISIELTSNKNINNIGRIAILWCCKTWTWKSKSRRMEPTNQLTKSPANNFIFKCAEPEKVASEARKAVKLKKIGAEPEYHGRCMTCYPSIFFCSHNQFKILKFQGFWVGMTTFCGNTTCANNLKILHFGNKKLKRNLKNVDCFKFYYTKLIHKITCFSC